MLRSLERVTRQTIRTLLWLALLASCGFAAWGWFRPYAWSPDPMARCQVVGTLVRQDASYCWVNIHLNLLPGTTHDLLKPVRLISNTGREIEPADTTMSGDPQRGTHELWLKFWLEKTDLNHSLVLRINDGQLTIKDRQGMPDLGASGSRYFTTQHW